MANLKNLSDHELDAAALTAAKNERLALVVVLEHLAEVDLRKTFSPRFENLVAYVIGHLGYDSKSAWRRVSALRLMQELPEIAPAIESGKLDLTKIVLAQSHFRNEAKATLMSPAKTATISFEERMADSRPKEIAATIGPAAKISHTRPGMTKAEKIEVLNSVMSVSSREAQRNLISKSSAPEKLKHPDLVKPLAGQSNEVRLILSDEDLAALQELKGLLAHKIPNASLSELIGAALKEAIASIKIKRSCGKSESSQKNESGENTKRRAACERVGSEKSSAAAPDASAGTPDAFKSTADAEIRDVAAKRVGTSAESKTRNTEDTRRPGAALKRAVWNRGDGKCEICESRFALEYDHRVPFANGGKTTFENLRLVCRNCNQRESIKTFGPRLKLQ